LWNIPSTAAPLARSLDFQQGKRTAIMPVVRPGVIVDEAIINGSVEEVFDALADFSLSEQWDPGVVTAQREQEGEIAVGSSFALVTDFKGKQSEMRYEITELQRPNRIVLRGAGDLVSAVDTMVLSPAGNGQVKVAYTADLSLKGLMRPFVIFLRSSFNQLGENAMAGMEKYFNQTAPLPSASK